MALDKRLATKDYVKKAVLEGVDAVLKGMERGGVWLVGMLKMVKLLKKL